MSESPRSDKLVKPFVVATVNTKRGEVEARDSDMIVLGFQSLQQRPTDSRHKAYKLLQKKSFIEAMNGKIVAAMEAKEHSRTPIVFSDTKTDPDFRKEGCVFYTRRKDIARRKRCPCLLHSSYKSESRRCRVVQNPSEAVDNRRWNPIDGRLVC